MRNRLIMGALRYETFAEKFKSDHNYNLIESAIERLQEYQKTGNMEHLVDASNLCMIEYESPSNKKAHWDAVDDTHLHCKKK
jgi:hypothetical protein